MIIIKKYLSEFQLLPNICMFMTRGFLLIVQLSIIKRCLLLHVFLLSFVSDDIS